MPPESGNIKVMAEHTNGANQNDPPLPPPENGGKGNVVSMKDFAALERARKDAARKDAQAATPPIINMPALTKYLIGAIIGIQLINALILSPEQSNALIANFGFVPARFLPENFTAEALITPLTSMFLHGGWMHLFVNAFMLAAFGSGVERWLGPKRMAFLFILSGLCGVALHYVLNMSSPYPMIGASGGISGLFAAGLIMINRGGREIGGRFGILPMALLWIGVSVAFGMMGAPGGGAIAWAAHVGGFLGGLAILKAMRL